MFPQSQTEDWAEGEKQAALKYSSGLHHLCKRLAPPRHPLVFTGSHQHGHREKKKPSSNLASEPQSSANSASPRRISTWLALREKTATKGSRFVSNQTGRLRGIYSGGSRSAARHYLISGFGLYCTSQAPQSHLPGTLSDMGHLHFFLHSNNLRQINTAEFNLRWINEPIADDTPRHTAACGTKVELHALHTTQNNEYFFDI